MSSPHPPPEPPHWGTDAEAARPSAGPAATRPASEPGQTPAPAKRDQSAVGEEDPGSALDSLDTEAAGQPETQEPSKP